MILQAYKNPPLARCNTIFLFLSIGLLSVAVGIWITLEGWIGALALIGIIGTGFAFLTSIPKPRNMVFFAVVVSGMAGSLAAIKISSLPFSLSGALTLVIFSGVSLALFPRLITVSTYASIKSYRLFLIFLLYLGIRTLGSSSMAEGIRQFVLFATPVAVGILAARELSGRMRTHRTLETMLLAAPILPAFILAMSAILGALEWTQLGFRAFLGFGPRPLALFLLPFLALYVSTWRYARDTKESTLSFLASLAVIILIIVSLSRIASMIAILIVLPGRFWHKSKMSQFAFGLVVGIGLITLWLGSPVVQQRFFPHQHGVIWDRNAIDMLRSVDTQGRKNLWAVTWLSAIQEPIFGHGTGSSRVLINKTYPPLEHPHNDYLRILHDAGLVGLVLFLIAWGERLLRHWKKWWWLDKHKQRGARYHMAAFLSGIAMCTSFLTDNTMTYIFVGIPMFLLFALADTVALPQVNSKPALVNENSDHT